MTIETKEESSAWPCAVTLVTSDGERSFRFRVDPVAPEKLFGRGGNPLRESPGAVPIKGMIVAEIRLPEVKLAAGVIRAEWVEPEFADVVAIAEAARRRLGRLGSHPSTFITPKARAPLEVLAVRWTRWAGDDLNEHQAPKFLGPGARFRIASRSAADGDDGEVVVGKAEMSRKTGQSLVDNMNRVYPNLVRWLVPADAHAVRAYDREHSSEVAGRELILFEEGPEEELDAADRRMIDESAKYLLLVRRACRAEELLGEAIDLIDGGINPMNAPKWIEKARPFARFREAK